MTGPKRCTKCKEVYTDPATSFHKHAGQPDGLQSRCKECVKVSARARYQRNSVAILERQRVATAAKRALAPISYKDTEARRKARRMRAKLAAARLLMWRD